MIKKVSQGHQVVSKSGKPLSKPNLTKPQETCEVLPNATLNFKCK